MERELSLVEYAKETDQEERFLEYLEMFTGYSEHVARPISECKDIYEDFKEKYAEKMTYDEFYETYKWHFVRERQLSHISHEEENNMMRILETLSTKVNSADTRTFSEWKDFFYNEKENLEPRELFESAEFFNETILPIFNGQKTDIIQIHKDILAECIEWAYQEGKKH